MRKRRRGEVNCTCGAYKFPHREMGGRCDGSYFVSGVWEDQTACSGCMFRVEQNEDGYKLECQVLEGLEPCTRCPELQDYIRYNDIKLYGVNK